MAGIKEEKKIYLVGIYCRLSKDDGTDNESASIATQKSILTDYVKKQGWHIAKTYVDDGYSGTNFQRPSFQNMIKDIESGLINCVITKDLSRLGRNYLDCGLYLEVFFPEHNVRYIAVNDGVDTLNKSAMPQRLEAAKAQLDNLYQQQAAAKEEVGKPFLYEEELRSKNARLVELDTLLNIDGKGQAHTESVVAKSTRPSVLDSLKRPATPRSTDKKPKQHEEVR